MNNNACSGRGGSVRTDQIPKLTDLEISNRTSAELVIDKSDIAEGFKTRLEGSQKDVHKVEG